MGRFHRVKVRSARFVIAFGAAAALTATACDEGVGGARTAAEGGLDARSLPLIDGPSSDATNAVPPMTFDVTGPTTDPLCNGDRTLCARAYDQTAFLGSHQSMAVGDPPWRTPTQGRTITLQLQSTGVRALELEVHSRGGVLVLCAGSCVDGNESLSNVLTEVATFMANNSTDVLTLLFRSHVPGAELAASLDAAGLTPLAHTQPFGAPWPTLGDMIARNRRLVVFVDESAATTTDAGQPARTDAGDGGDLDGSVDARAEGSAALPPPAFLHLTDQWMWETDPSVGPDCDPSGGDSKNPLFVLNHYVPGESPGDAGMAAHDADRVAARLERCRVDRGHLPLLVLVDFAELPDPFGGVRVANGLR